MSVNGGEEEARTVYPNVVAKRFTLSWRDVWHCAGMLLVAG